MALKFICDCGEHYSSSAALLACAASNHGNHGNPLRGFDFIPLLIRQIQFSATAFGPGTRTKGVLDHIRKEIGEIEADPMDLEEWIDVAILAFDGAWRLLQNSLPPRNHHAIAAEILTMYEAKIIKNENRKWPDWRTMSENVAIEHDRDYSGDMHPPVTRNPKGRTP